MLRTRFFARTIDVVFLILFALLGLAGCRNIFLEEMFSDKTNDPVENILITDSRRQQIQAFDPNMLSYTYSIDGTVRIKVVLNRTATVRWGYGNLNNLYSGEIAVVPSNGTTQILISVTGKRGVAKVYTFNFLKTSAYYLKAGVPDGGDGSYAHPFNLFSIALEQAANTHIKTILVIGEIPATSSGREEFSSVFIVPEGSGGGRNIDPIRFSGLAGTNAALVGIPGKRVLEVRAESVVRFENIVIKSNDAGNFNGGGILIKENASVILGNGADVQGSGTGRGSGVCVGHEQGQLVFAGSGKVSVGDVFIPDGNTILIEDTLTSPLAATITPANYPTMGNPISVLSGTYSLLNRHYMQFAVSDVRYVINNMGKIETGMYYVKSTGRDSSDGLSLATAFGTLAQALEAVNTDSIRKTIIVSGTLTAANAGVGTVGDRPTDEVRTDNSVFIINNTAAGTEILIKGISNAALNATGAEMRAVGIKDDSNPVRFESIRITGGNARIPDTVPRRGGGGLYISTGATVSFGHNTIVTGNTVTGADATTGSAASVYGGGVFIAEQGILTVDGDSVRIDHNTALAGHGISTGSGAASHGGGVYVASNATFTIAGDSISIDHNRSQGGNGASGAAGIGNGGGVYVAGNGELEINGDSVNIDLNIAQGGNSDNGAGGALGGGVYVSTNGTVTIDGSWMQLDGNIAQGGSVLTVTKTPSGALGGGVYSAGSVTVTTARITVKNNKAFIGEGNTAVNITNQGGGLWGISGAYAPAATTATYSYSNNEISNGTASVGPNYSVNGTNG